MTILMDDFIPIDEVEGTETAASSIYAVKFGAEGIMGLQSGGIPVEAVGELETKDATRHRIKWYAGLSRFSELGVARLKGINPS